jgi:hypothetical protein
MPVVGWTAADAAELDVLVYALVESVFEHREKCARCAGPEPCPHVQAAIAQVCDWREKRLLLSKAEALRDGNPDRPWCCNALSTEIDGVMHYWHRPDCRFPWPDAVGTSSTEGREARRQSVVPIDSAHERKS